MHPISLLPFVFAIACSGSANGVAVDGVLDAAMGAVTGTNQACQAGPRYGAHCEQTAGLQGASSSMHRADARDAPEAPEDRQARLAPRAGNDDPDSLTAPIPSQAETLPKGTHGSNRNSAAPEPAPPPNGTIWRLLSSAIKSMQSECPSSRTTNRSGEVTVRVGLSFYPNKQLRLVEIQLEPRSPRAFSSPALDRKGERGSIVSPAYQDASLSRCIEAILRKLETPTEPPPEQLSFELVLGG